MTINMDLSSIKYEDVPCSKPILKVNSKPLKKKKKKKEKIRYVILAETNDDEAETWLYFLKYNGNQKALKNLKEQLDTIEFDLFDDISMFDLDIQNMVSEQTAKEMIKPRITIAFPYKKFDGELQLIDFGFEEKDDNDLKIIKVFEKIGLSKIEEYIDEEDFDETDERRYDNDKDSIGLSSSEDDGSIKLPGNRILKPCIKV